MKNLFFSLTELNKKSPYLLKSAGMFSFSFDTDQGKHYEIGFIQDLMISDDGIYQFFISTEDHFKTSPEKKVQQTVMIVVEEFFKNEGVVLDYICDTEDHRQAARDRMFRQWFASSESKNQYCQRSISIEIDGVDYFSTFIMRNDNPRYQIILDAIDCFIEDFIDKLNNFS